MKLSLSSLIIIISFSLIQSQSDEFYEIYGFLTDSKIEAKSIKKDLQNRLSDFHSISSQNLISKISPINNYPPHNMGLLRRTQNSSSFIARRLSHYNQHLANLNVGDFSDIIKFKGVNEERLFILFKVANKVDQDFIKSELNDKISLSIDEGKTEIIDALFELIDVLSIPKTYELLNWTRDWNSRHTNCTTPQCKKQLFDEIDEYTFSFYLQHKNLLPKEEVHIKEDTIDSHKEVPLTDEAIALSLMHETYKNRTFEELHQNHEDDDKNDSFDEFLEEKISDHNSYFPTAIIVFVLMVCVLLFYKVTKNILLFLKANPSEDEISKAEDFHIIKEREAREREAREKEVREKEVREKEVREKEVREKEVRETIRAIPRIELRTCKKFGGIIDDSWVTGFSKIFFHRSEEMTKAWLRKISPDETHIITDDQITIIAYRAMLMIAFLIEKQCKEDNIDLPYDIPAFNATVVSAEAFYSLQMLDDFIDISNDIEKDNPILRDFIKDELASVLPGDDAHQIRLSIWNSCLFVYILFDMLFQVKNLNNNI